MKPPFNVLANKQRTVSEQFPYKGEGEEGGVMKGKPSKKEMKVERELEGKPNSGGQIPIPTFAEIKVVVAHVVPLSMALLAVASFTNTRPTTKLMKKALREAGYSNPKDALSDLDKLEPFFTAVVSDLKIFRENLRKLS